MNVLQSILSFILLFVVIHVYSLNLSPQYYAKTKSVECDWNHTIITNGSCKLKAINWEQTDANLECDLLVPLRNVSIRLEVFKFTNQFRPFLINVSFNLCDLMMNRKGNIYATTALNIIAKYTNLNHSCPYTGHVVAYGLYVDNNFIPFYIPSATYKLVFTFDEGWPLIRIGTIGLATTIVERINKTRTKPKKKNYSIISN